MTPQTVVSAHASRLLIDSTPFNMWPWKTGCRTSKAQMSTLVNDNRTRQIGARVYCKRYKKRGVVTIVKYEADYQQNITMEPIYTHMQWTAV